jgi:hypothetical protein
VLYVITWTIFLKTKNKIYTHTSKFYGRVLPCSIFLLCILFNLSTIAWSNVVITNMLEKFVTKCCSTKTRVWYFSPKVLHVYQCYTCSPIADTMDKIQDKKIMLVCYLLLTIIHNQDKSFGGLAIYPCDNHL